MEPKKNISPGFTPGASDVGQAMLVWDEKIGGKRIVGIGSPGDETGLAIRDTRLAGRSDDSRVGG